jgi:hypothetical protein
MRNRLLLIFEVFVGLVGFVILQLISFMVLTALGVL